MSTIKPVIQVGDYVEVLGGNHELDVKVGEAGRVIAIDETISPASSPFYLNLLIEFPYFSSTRAGFHSIRMKELLYSLYAETPERTPSLGHVAWVKMGDLKKIITSEFQCAD